MIPDDINLEAIDDPWSAIVAVVLILALIVWPSIAAWINTHKAKTGLETVRTTLQENNGGGSVRDSLDRIEAAQKEHGDTLAAVVQRVEALERRPRRWFS